MKVRDVMHTSFVAVQEESPIKNIARLIFSGNIYSFPVLSGKKLVGFITEEDIFFGMHGQKDEISYDKNKLALVLEKKAKDLMVKNVISTKPDVKLEDAQSLMYKHNFAQIPVIDEDGVLVGMVTRANVFRNVLEEEIPRLEQGQYAEFMAENYDLMVDWDKRTEYEFPTLFRIFKNNKVKKIMDLGSWTGEYAIRLAREGIEVIGVDHNELMVALAKDKRSKLPDNIKKRVDFELSDFLDLTRKFKSGSFDGVVSLGTSLAYLPQKPEHVLKDLHKIIKKDGVIVLQLLNMERVIEEKGRFLNFKIKKTDSKEELFIEYFDKKNENTLMHNIVNFTRDGGRWIFGGINSIEVHYIKNDEVATLLQNAGFKDISITGNKGEYKGQFGQMSLIKPFYPQTSEWMTVVAKA